MKPGEGRVTLEVGRHFMVAYWANVPDATTPQQL